MKPTRRRIRWGAVGLVAVIAATGLYGMSVLRHFGGKNNSFTDILGGIVNPKGQFQNRDRVTILVVGRDYNHDSKGIEYTTGSRADTVMLVSADLNSGKLATLSVPRDTRVEAPDGKTGKINATLQRGGIKLLEDTLNQCFGIHPDYYVLLKADAVKRIVDSVGGVEVDALDDMFYEDWWDHLKINISKGHHRLAGQEAVGYVRFRKSGTHRFDEQGNKFDVPYKASLEEGDIRRTERQQIIIRGLTQEIFKPTNLARLGSIIDTGFGSLETDLTRPQVLALGKLFRGKSLSSAPGTTLPGGDAKIGGIYYYEPDLERGKLAVDWIINGNEMSGKKLVRVSVSYLKGARKSADSAVEQLTPLGYTVTKGGGHKTEDGQPEVSFRKAAFAEDAAEIGKLLGITKIVKAPAASAREDWLPEIHVSVK